VRWLPLALVLLAVAGWADVRVAEALGSRRGGFAGRLARRAIFWGKQIALYASKISAQNREAYSGTDDYSASYPLLHRKVGVLAVIQAVALRDVYLSCRWSLVQTLLWPPTDAPHESGKSWSPATMTAGTGQNVHG
jgi:hypothetical protein